MDLNEHMVVRQPARRLLESLAIYIVSGRDPSLLDRSHISSVLRHPSSAVEVDTTYLVGTTYVSYTIVVYGVQKKYDGEAFAVPTYYISIDHQPTRRQGSLPVVIVVIISSRPVLMSSLKACGDLLRQLASDSRDRKLRAE